MVGQLNDIKSQMNVIKGKSRFRGTMYEMLLAFSAFCIFGLKVLVSHSRRLRSGVTTSFCC
jgi:hypothetical protein